MDNQEHQQLQHGGFAFFGLEELQQFCRGGLCFSSFVSKG